jgi:hypothetical protein
MIYRLMNNQFMLDKFQIIFITFKKEDVNYILAVISGF